MPEVGQPKTVVYRLNDLEVQEVSLVDLPANQRKFLLVKNAGSPHEDSMDTDKTIDTDKTSDAVDDAMAAKAGEETSLVTELEAATQVALGDMLQKAGDRLLALAVSVKAAKVAEKAFDADKPQIPPKLMQEVVNIRAAIDFGELGKSAADKAKAMADPDKKKEVEGKPGAPKPKAGKPKPGSKPEDEDDKGKGKPAFLKADELVRDLLKSPAFDGDPTAAIELLEKADLEAEAMSLLYVEAGKSALRTAQDACFDGDYMKAAKYAGMSFNLLSKYAGLMSPIGISMSEQIDTIGKTITAKAGAKMSQARFDELDKSLRALLELAEQVKPGYTADLSPVTKRAGSGTIQQLVDLVRKQKDEIAALQGGARPPSNAPSIGEGAPPKPFRWESDLNADYTGAEYRELQFD